jgi:hypothetical protein
MSKYYLDVMDETLLAANAIRLKWKKKELHRQVGICGA